MVGRNEFGFRGAGPLSPPGRLAVVDDPSPESVGKPIGTVDMLVLDDEARECPRGVVGEICCRPADGAPVGVEYFANPEASARKLCNGWVRSGDMGHMDADGWLFFDYRSGGGIRRNGDFIDAGFVELVIAEHSQVEARSAVTRD